VWQLLDRDTRVDEIYHLAANMGGIGFIETNKGVIVRDNTMININTSRLFESTAQVGFCLHRVHAFIRAICKRKVYVTPLKREDAYPADAEDGYGRQKLFMELTCRHYREDFRLDTRVVRFHNIYVPLGTYDGGREKSPAAICRKLALAENGDAIEVWGDGQQTRSYCYIDDCVEGIHRLMRSDHHEPLNLGTDRLVSIDELADIVATIACKTVHKRHDLTKPQGVRGRNSDNSRLREVLAWEP